MTFQDTPSVRPYEYKKIKDKIVVHIPTASLEASQVATIKCNEKLKGKNFTGDKLAIAIKVVMLDLVTTGVLEDSGNYVNIKRLLELYHEK